MFVVIDQGNTFTKIAAVSGDEIVDAKTYNKISRDHIVTLLETFKKRNNYSPIEWAILSSVTTDNGPITTTLQSRMNLLVLSGSTPIPLKNSYGTPETLGNDRIAAAVGASQLHPESNVLVIDAGTSITYDMVRSGKEYLGGGIAPGIEMRFKALNTFTSKLPLVSRNDVTPLIGKSTVESIQSGVLNGVLAEVDGIIHRYKQEFPDLKIIFTGGDLNYFDRKLKSNIFAIPNLVLLGLKDILKYNVENK